MKEKILIKLSGESIGDKVGRSFDENQIEKMCQKIKELSTQFHIFITIGGGNIIRGRDFDHKSISQRVSIDQAGMLSTVTNAIILDSYLKNLGLNSKVFAAFEILGIVEQYSLQKINFYKDNIDVFILSGGIANPFFSTDLSAVVRAIENECSILVKASTTDGIYSKDPNSKNSSAESIEKYKKISYDEIINKKIEIMDYSAVLMAKKFNLDIFVINFNKIEYIRNIIYNESGNFFTLITNC